MEISYELSLTYDCNWHCDYCIVDTYDRPKRQFKDILKEIELFKNNSSVTLGGGEPGMATSNEVKTIISLLKRKNITIDLLTNGLFFKKHYTSVPDISEIFYHCIENLSEKKDIEFPSIDKKDFYYILVASSNELNENLTYYFDKYPDIKFVISANIKPGERVNTVAFIKFINRYRNNISDRTLVEFVKNTAKG